MYTRYEIIGPFTKIAHTGIITNYEDFWDEAEKQHVDIQEIDDMFYEIMADFQGMNDVPELLSPGVMKDDYPGWERTKVGKLICFFSEEGNYTYTEQIDKLIAMWKKVGEKYGVALTISTIEIPGDELRQYIVYKDIYQAVANVPADVLNSHIVRRIEINGGYHLRDLEGVSGRIACEV